MTYSLIAWLSIGLFIQMIRFEGPTIQTYEIAEAPTESANLLDNRMVFAMRMRGVRGGLNPRAAILEFGYKAYEGGIRYMTPPEDRHRLFPCNSTVIDNSLNLIDE